MRRIGFSTGAIAKGDFRKAIRTLELLASRTNAIELSALREDELDSLVDAIPHLDLRRFEYVSFHAPSSRVRFSENEFVQRLKRVALHTSNIVVHPDVIEHATEWESIQEYVILENMDQRKGGARTVKELQRYFDALPSARFCFDIGHARQVDPTLSVAVELIRAFADRLAEIHVSEVDAASKHVAISFAAMESYRRIAALIPGDVPAIIESMVSPDELNDEVQIALASLGGPLPESAPCESRVVIG